MKKVLFGIVPAACLIVAGISTAAASELTAQDIVQEFQSKAAQVREETERMWPSSEEPYSPSKWEIYGERAAEAAKELMLEGLKKGMELKGLPTFKGQRLTWEQHHAYDLWLKPIIQNMSESIWIPKYCKIYGIDEEDFKKYEAKLMSDYEYRTKILNMSHRLIFEKQRTLEHEFPGCNEKHLQVRDAIVAEIEQLQTLFDYISNEAVVPGGTSSEELRKTLEKVVIAYCSEFGSK